MYFAAGEMYEINLSLQNFVYFVCFASQNAILSQPSADSPFHCAAVGGFAALRMRRPPCGEKEPIPPSPAGQAFHPPGGRCPRRGRMRGRPGPLLFRQEAENVKGPTRPHHVGQGFYPCLSLSLPFSKAPSLRELSPPKAVTEGVKQRINITFCIKTPPVTAPPCHPPLRTCIHNLKRPPERFFCRPAALKNLEIHKGFLRFFALLGGKISRSPGIFAYEYRFLLSR